MSKPESSVRESETMMYVAHNDDVIGLIGVRDHVRPEARAALAELRTLGVRRVRMLTGDQLGCEQAN